MVKDEIFLKLQNRLKTIEKNHGYFSELCKKRFVNEKLIQLEVLKIISELETVEHYLPEKCYPELKKKVDLWFSTNDKNEHWLEIKMRGTNYHNKNAHGKAITHGINGVIEDIGRLRELPSNFKKYVMFSFLPVFDDRKNFFNPHISKIEKVLGKKIEDYITIRLKDDSLKDGYFVIYFEEVNVQI